MTGFATFTPRNQLPQACGIGRPNHKRASGLAAGQALALALVALTTLSISAHASLMRLDRPVSPFPESTDQILQAIDERVNENHALTLVGRTDALKPFGGSSVLERWLQETRNAENESADDEAAFSEQVILEPTDPNLAYSEAPQTFDRFILNRHTPRTTNFFTPLGQGDLNWRAPILADYTCSPFGQRHGRPHNGVDLCVSLGTPVRPTAAGVVVHAKPYYGYGNLITIDHGNGVKSRYAHLGQMFVHQGDHVFQDQVIGTVGMTGSSSGPHLHFELLFDGVAQNPERYIYR